MLLSVIIPVYNTEKYLRECVDSILSQAVSDIEIILVDDGSTDRSSAICDEYAARYENITVIRQPNGGASAARNTGMEHATGEFILFVDSDDWIAPDSLVHIKSLSACDVTFLRADIVKSDMKPRRWSYTYDNGRLTGRSGDEVLRYLAEVSRFPVSPAIKLLRREFLVQNGIAFTTGIVCEDVDYMIQILLSAQSFSSCDFPYYLARHAREGSVMTSRSGALKRFTSTLSIIRKWAGHSDIVHAILAVQYLYLMSMYQKLESADRRKCRSDMEEFSWLMRHGRHKIFLPAMVVRSLFGLRCCALFLSALMP